MTIASTIMFLASLAELIAFIISFKGYIQKRYPHFKYMSVIWLSLFMSNFVLGIAYVTMDSSLYRIGMILSAPIGFAMMGLVDTISQEKIRYESLFINSVILTSFFIFILEAGSVVQNTTILGETTLALSGNAMIATSIVFLYAGLLWVFFMAKIHIHAPKSIKKISKINLMGAIIAAPGSIVAFSTGFIWIFPGTDFLLIGIGGIACAYSFHKQPKLGYVLPFKTYRLICVNSISGTSFYKYDWDSRGIVDEALLSGALQGISLILKESIQKGEIQEIRFDEGILMFHRIPENNILFALLVSKPSSILKESLEHFGTTFVKQYHKVIESDLVDLNEFADADFIVEATFPYVPQYSS